MRRRQEIVLTEFQREYVWDVEQAQGQSPHNALCSQSRFQALLHVPVQPFRRRDLLYAIPEHYRKAILRLHPAFAHHVLGLTGSSEQARA